jgi:predicted nucleotidyltransferase component of viral defense system
MGTLSLLTKEQQSIYSEIAKNEYIRSNFYFTGGTALSSYYLQHRYSDDLDFFSEKEFNTQAIFNFIGEMAKKYNFTFESRFEEVVYIFDLIFTDGYKLKLDFSFYPYKQLEKGDLIENLPIDSLFDIATNKIVTVSQRNDVKDFVDLYYLLQKFSLWDLISAAKLKFKLEIDPFLLATDFLKVEDFTFLPKMIKPLTLPDLKAFYSKTAKDLSQKSVE